MLENFNQSSFDSLHYIIHKKCKTTGHPSPCGILVDDFASIPSKTVGLMDWDLQLRDRFLNKITKNKDVKLWLK